MLEELSGDIGFAFNAFQEEHEHQRLEEEKLQNYEQILYSMIELIENRDSYTAGHTQRVAQYCTMIAEAMGYSTDEINLLHKAAMLHDIGKIQTPDAILLKPGKLGSIEYELIQGHVSAGYNMLHRIDMYRDLAEIMRHHHEHFDGSGYPNRLHGDQIPPLSRIMIVADAFDAMTTSRIYKPRMSLQDALNELQLCSGTQFHPEVIDIAVRVLAAIQLEPVHQLPTNLYDYERLSYYYKDKLTGTFNYDYLQVVLINKEVFGIYTHLYAVWLRGFGWINQEKGWAYGDWLLQSFGTYLNSVAEEGLVFRRHGDDFIILSKKEIPLSSESIKHEDPIFTMFIDTKVISIDLEKERISDIETLEALLTTHAPTE